MKKPLTVEPGKESVTGHCDTCGHETRVFRGFVYDIDGAFGVYVASYTEAHPELGVLMAVSLRGWGSGSDSSAKECVTIEWLLGATGLGCRVVDAASTPWSGERSLGRMLSREDALSSGRSVEAFDVTDVVWVSDPRLERALVAQPAVQADGHAPGQ